MLKPVAISPSIDRIPEQIRLKEKTANQRRFPIRYRCFARGGAKQLLNTWAASTGSLKAGLKLVESHSQQNQSIDHWQLVVQTLTSTVESLD